LVLLNELVTAYCVPEAGGKYKRLIEFAQNPCGFSGDGVGSAVARRGGGLGRRLSLALLAQGDFLAIYRDIARRLDADADLRTVDGHHRYFYLIADAQRLTGSASEYQHRSAPADSMKH
jgi:hypothetical protein